MSRVLLSLVLTVTFALPVTAGEYSNLAAGILAMYSKPVTPVPGPAPKPSTVCENCSGTGKLGDGTVAVTCPVCNGTGKTTTAAPEGCPCPDCQCGANCPCPKFTAFDRRLTDLEAAVISNQSDVMAAIKELRVSLEKPQAAPVIAPKAKVAPKVEAKPVARSGYPVRSGHWTFPGGDIYKHLLEGHSGKQFDQQWLMGLTYNEARSLHDDLHEGRARADYIVYAKSTSTQPVAATKKTFTVQKPTSNSSCPGGVCPINPGTRYGIFRRR